MDRFEQDAGVHLSVGLFCCSTPRTGKSAEAADHRHLPRLTPVSFSNSPAFNAALITLNLSLSTVYTHSPYPELLFVYSYASELPSNPITHHQNSRLHPPNACTALLPRTRSPLHTPSYTHNVNSHVQAPYWQDNPHNGRLLRHRQIDSPGIRPHIPILSPPDPHSPPNGRPQTSRL